MTRRWVALGLLLVLASACGEDHTGPRAKDPATLAPVAAAPPDTPGPVSDRERARFALDRVLRGPLPRTATFAIPHFHPVTLELATEDLVLLRDDTLALLSDPGLVARLTTAPEGVRNAWHSVLEVLSRLDDVPFDLARRWSVPALDTGDVPLVRRATGLLASHGDAAAGPPLLRALETWPTDRDIAPVAASALVRLGGTWRVRALRILLERGTANAQRRAAPWLLEAGNGDGAAAWWATFMEVGGPTPVLGLRPTLLPGWNVARIVTSDATWPREPAGIDRALSASRLLAPVDERERIASLPVAGGETACIPLETFRYTGALAAAEAACRLAIAGHAPWVATVLADRAGPDPVRQVVARDCSTGRDDEATAEQARRLVTTFLDAIADGLGADPDGVAAALRRVRPAGEEDRLAWRLLEEARPAAAYAGLLRAAYDRLATSDAAAVDAWVEERLLDEDPESRALAIEIVRTSPKAAYLPALETLLDRAGSRRDLDPMALRKLLAWVYGRATDVPPDRVRAFARRFAAWIDETPDPWAATLAPALLDLGDAGAEVYAAGLRGDRRDAYLQGLIARGAIVAPVVAEALLAPVDASTSRPDRQAAWIAAYLTAPAEAAGALAAARDRVDPANRAEVTDILEAVRHRAPR